jgi:hypothetical protein
MLSSTVATVAFRTALIAVTGGLILLLPLAISAFSAMADAAEDAQRSQELLNEVNKKSIDGYAEETIQIDLAIKKLQDENLTRDDKAKIIDDLQHKYPEYLGNIKNEGALTEELSKAIKDKLIPALELEAKAKAAQQLATEKYKKILELQNEAIESGSTGLAYIQESLGAFLNNTTLMAKGNVKALQNTGDEINKLQKDLDGYLAIILDASDAVKKLGGGDPTGIKTTIINITKEIEARAKLIELIKQQQIELTKPASDNSENPEIFRLRALEKGYELEKQIITNRLNTSLQLNTIELEKIKHDLNERLTTEKHNAQEIADLNAQAASDERALLYQRKQLVLQTNDELYNADITYNIVRGKIHAYTLQQIVDEEKMSSEQIADYDKKKMDAELKAEQDHIKKRQDQDAINQDTELRVLDIEYQKKLIDEDEYQKKKFEIEKYYSLKSQADTITDLEKQIQKAKEAGQSTLDLERKIADEKRKIDDDLTKKLIDNRDKLVAREKEFANSVICAVQSLVDNGYERQKNAIQDQINLVDTKKQKEIDAVNASLNTEEKKAAQIAIINARADDQKTQLEKKQREQDIKKAQFDKLIGILQVGISTQRTIADLASKAAIAKAEAAVLAANPVTAAYAPIAFASAAAIAAQIPLALAQGAIQAGLIAAQPIPKYRTGTGDHPGGLMWAGDGGKSEIVIRPDGNAFVTPSVSTLYDMPRGTIVLPDADQAIEQSFNMMYKPLLPAMAGGGDAQVKMLSKKMDAVISAINGIPGTKVINTWSGVNTSYENVSRQWEYINRNTQS